MEMGSGSNGDGEEKKDAKELKRAEAMKEKAKGKRPMDIETVPNVETITEKTKEIVIDVAKARKAKGKEVAAGAGSGSKGSKGKQKENVVKSCYSLRSRSKGMMDIDVKPTVEMAAPGEKRKAGEKKRDFLLSRQACKKFKTARSKDDSDDKDGKGNAAEARTTRTRSEKRKVRSI
ncbi:hypothetical protein SSX86_026998 [Deinandra increscens subsp. villosa]|uniref:Uncharacterized protein n=1 Tax=Deinandra increscens subsp. villosa TaxID=3103831 RepID=A0AAP0CH00_9ASTR